MQVKNTGQDKASCVTTESYGLTRTLKNVTYANICAMEVFSRVLPVTTIEMLRADLPIYF